MVQVVLGELLVVLHWERCLGRRCLVWGALLVLSWVALHAGFVGGGLAGAATGAGVGAIHSNVEHFTITAKEVFQELANFRDNGDNTVSCTLTANSVSQLVSQASRIFPRAHAR